MKYAINLLPQKEAPLGERLMYFSLNYLRYIIVLTQLVVIGVFFYRFQIDQRIIDLQESVSQKQEIVQVVAPLLDEAADITNRTTESKQIFSEQSQYKQMMDYFISQFPASIILTNLKQDFNSLEITGLALDINQLQSFYGLLQSDKKFTTVNLESIEKSDVGYKFNLKLDKFKPS